MIRNHATGRAPRAARLAFHDHHPQANDFLRDVIHGLSRHPRRIGPKYFYDERGSQLFDAICRTPEYYPTRTEIGILECHADDIARHVGKRCVLIEPGSGNSRKVRILLDRLRPLGYLPIDISRNYLRATAGHVAAEYPWLAVHAVCADYTAPLTLPDCPPGAQRLVFFPGSTIGNFDPAPAAAFLRNMARLAGPDGGLLIGVDLKKDPDVLHAAYNDAQGITAAFNLNLLTRINRELRADFDLARFHHCAFYSTDHGRIEMHLVSADDQQVQVGDRRFDFVRDESIHTENSYKYSVGEFQELAQGAGWTPVAVWTDPARLFSVHYLQVQPAADGGH
jgi:dimethylhistidine N-methyltransferase